jgi:hypothetical protein
MSWIYLRARLPQSFTGNIAPWFQSKSKPSLGQRLINFINKDSRSTNKTVVAHTGLLTFTFDPDKSKTATIAYLSADADIVRSVRKSLFNRGLSGVWIGGLC